MTLISLVDFIRFKVLHISTKYIRWERRHLGLDEDTPFNHLVGMVANEIRNYCFRFGKEIYSGEGALVDLGSWLGSTVIPLAKGLQENLAGKSATIHAYDAFVWYENMSNSARNSAIEGKYKVGDCFLDEFKKQIAPYKQNIIAHKGDLNNVQWDSSPVEYMMIDAMKDWALAKKIVFTFYPHLIAGKAVIVHEDFCHHYTSWIHLIQYRLREYFEPLPIIKHSSGVAFKCIKPLPKLHLIIPDDYMDFSAEEIEAAFDYSLSLVINSNKPAVLAAKVMAYRHRGDYDVASKTLKKIPLAVRWLNFEVAESARALKADKS